jgi:hypothetical protein
MLDLAAAGSLVRGRTADFPLSAGRDKKAAKRFFRRAPGRGNTRGQPAGSRDRPAHELSRRDPGDEAGRRAVALRPAPARPLAERPGCKEIDERVNAFLDRPLEGEWPYLWLDATYLKVREGGRIVSVAAIIAVAVDA